MGSTVAAWHQGPIENPYSGLLEIVCQEHEFNYLLWHEEDIARSPDVTTERIAEVKPGQVLSIRRYDFQFDGMTNRQGPNYHELAAHFTVRHAGDLVGVMEPSKRSFPSRGTDTNEAALMTRGFAQLYLSLGEPGPDGAIAVRLYYKPLVLLIWLGAVVMAFGGALGVEGVPLPGVETGIALSAVLLGLMVALAAKPPLGVAAILVGAFAIFHGHAHGAELPVGADAVAFSMGFVVATGMLHLLGIAFGALSHWPSGRIAVRIAGGVISVLGFAFLGHMI